MAEHPFLADILIFLVAAVIAAALFRRLRSSLVIGFLAAGIVIGPHGFGLVADTDSTRNLAELGVVFLMFLIGLELTVERLVVMRRMVFMLGGAQVALTGLVIGVVAWLAGTGAEGAIVIGVGLAFSSTAVVLQLLAERGELTTRWGRTCVAVLLLQDLAVVPMLTLVPALAGDEISIARAVGLALIKAALAFAAIYFGGRLVLRPAMRLIAATGSPELFSAATLLVLLGSAWLTGLVGLSVALGGFIAGLLLAETEYRHQVAADMASFGGILLGLFFMVVGMSVDLGLIVSRAGTVAALVVTLVVVKAGLLAALCRLYGLAGWVSLRVALMLAQGGEFAFLLFILAVRDRIVSADIAALLVATVSATMVLTPLLAVLGAVLSRRLEAAGVAGSPVADDDGRPSGHVVIAGFGRVGRVVARMLDDAGIPYVAIEVDPARVALARAQGLPVFFGDARRTDVLHAVGAGQARAVVVIMDKADAAERTVELLRRRYPRINIVVRARDNDHRRKLEAAGATGIIHETFEMSLQLGGAALRQAGAPERRIDEIIASLRGEDYAPVSGIATGAVAAEDAPPARKERNAV